MMPSSPQESALYIECLRNHYMVQDHAPEEMRARCEAALATSLPHMLAAALGPLLSAQDSSLWFVRHLNLELSAEHTIEHAQIGEVWAKEIARGLMDALESEEPGVLHFPDRASYLAHFLLDLAAGAAWDRWYYSIFDGLRMLSLSAAMRTAICELPQDGLRALHLLSEDQRHALIKALSTADARRVLSALGTELGDGSAADCLSPLVRHWNAGLVFHDPGRRSLALFVAVSGERPELAGEDLRAMVVAACRLAGFLDEQPDDGAVLAAIRAADLAALYALLGTAAELLVPLLHAPSDLFDDLLQRVRGEPVVSSAGRREMRFTAFGGAFLLLPILDDFPFERATADWPGMGDVGPAALVRFLVLAKCFGRTHAQGCMRDPVVRDLLQIPPTISPQAAAEWLGRISPDRLHSFLQVHAAWHMDNGTADAEAFLLTRVSHRGAPVTVLLDCEHGVWLFAKSRSRQAKIDFDLPQPMQLWCDKSLWDLGCDAFPQTPLRSMGDVDNDSFPSSSALARDLSYLGLPRDLNSRRSADFALSVAAQGVLRCFALKLPGFGKSSPDYLHRNFLDCCAAVEETAERMIVSLAKPPLHLVLGMAGLDHRSYRLSWLQGRLCSIFPEG